MKVLSNNMYKYFWKPDYLWKESPTLEIRLENSKPFEVTSSSFQIAK